MFRLTSQQLVPVYSRICPVYPYLMHRHGPSDQFNAAFGAWDMSPYFFMVWCPQICELPTHRLLQYARPWCSGLARHCPIICDVSDKPELTEDANEKVEHVLKPLWVLLPNHAVVGIEKPQEYPHIDYQSLLRQHLIFVSHHQPRPHHISTTILNRVCEMSQPCVVPRLALKFGPW